MPLHGQAATQSGLAQLSDDSVLITWRSSQSRPTVDMLRVSLKDGSYNTFANRNGIHDRPDLCTEVKNPTPERIEPLSRKGSLFPVARVFWIHAMAADNFTLHEMHKSGNCYKIRLTAALIGTKLDLIEYNTLNGETRTQDYLLNINSNGRIPVLQIG